VKWYGKYGRKVSWIVKRYRKYGRKVRWIETGYGKYGRMEVEKWKDTKHMEEK
jgi:hypothetical protein